jgi:hypothetical protein
MCNVTCDVMCNVTCDVTHDVIPDGLTLTVIRDTPSDMSTENPKTLVAARLPNAMVEEIDAIVARSKELTQFGSPWTRAEVLAEAVKLGLPLLAARLPESKAEPVAQPAAKPAKKTKKKIKPTKSIATPTTEPEPSK